MGVADELSKLQALRDKGTLTSEEFARAKALLLGNPPTESPTPTVAPPRGDALGAAAGRPIRILVAVLAIFGAALAYLLVRLKADAPPGSWPVNQSWILYDPRNDRFRDTSGAVTDNWMHAECYPSEQEARKKAGNGFEPRPIKAFFERQWILHDPRTNRFWAFDGSATDELVLAKVYASEEEARKEAPNDYVPRRLADFPPRHRK